MDHINAPEMEGPKYEPKSLRNRLMLDDRNERMVHMTIKTQCNINMPPGEDVPVQAIPSNENAHSSKQ